MASSPVERLLLALEGAPHDAAELVFAALRARLGSQVRDALTQDPRFVPWLLPAFRDRRIRKEIPYLSRLIARHGLREAIPDLLAAWGEDGGATAENAGFALLDLADPTSLATLASQAATRQGVARTVAFRAAFALSPATEAFTRLAEHLGEDHFALTLFGFLTSEGERAGGDPRWQRAAVEAVQGRTPEVARAARGALVALAGEAAAHQAERGRANPDAPRRRVERALARLVDQGFTLRPPAAPARLAQLEELIGPLPPTVRALYETCDGLRVEGNPPHEIYPLSIALEAAERWLRVERPGEVAADLVRPFELPVAPDAYRLRGLSGGPDLAIAFPWNEADPIVRHAPRSPRFSTLVLRAVRVASKGQSA